MLCLHQTPPTKAQGDILKRGRGGRKIIRTGGGKRLQGHCFPDRTGMMQYEPTETMTASASVRPGQVQTGPNPSMEKNGEGTQSLIPNQKTISN